MSMNPWLSRVRAIKRVNERDRPSAADFNTLVDAIAAALNITGPNVHYGDNGIHIAEVPAFRKEELFIATVNSSTETTSGSNRWTYDIDEVEKSSDGYDGWAVKTNGRTSTSAYNLAESDNPTTAAGGVLGNSVDQANLEGTFAMQPIPDGAYVAVKEVRVLDDGSIEYWIIGQVQSVDGACA